MEVFPALGVLRSSQPYGFILAMRYSPVLRLRGPLVEEFESRVLGMDA